MWVNQDMQAKGASETEALAFAGTMLGLSQVFNIGTSPVIGFVIDRINRVYMVIITAVVSLIAYYSMFFLSDATTTWMLIIIVFVSIGNTGVTVSCNVLLADASKNEERGAVMGLYKLLGSLGMFGAAVVGGYLFDYRHWSPFAFIGGFNTILTIVAIVVAIITRNK
jgi:MFS family permease